ncbi:MAG: hypothetical protein NZL85_10745, partial [Fimbriimonadales bacterium]|nr:hypothetical protein [Fimbriimonadales bacterium]
MRVGTGLICLILSLSAWAQGYRNARIAYDRERNAYYLADELVVGLEPNAPSALAQQAVQWVGQLREANLALGSRLVRVEGGLNPDDVRAFLLSLPGVRYVERNYLAFACNQPNDPMFPQQWGLLKIQAPAAWAQWQPQRTIYIAILDTGIDATHPDLAQKMRRHNNGTVYG